jgi:hypothetical protein
VLYLQHPQAEFTKRSDSNSAFSLLQDQLLQRLEFVLVLREGRHVQNSWLHVDGVFWYTKHVHYTLVWI